jgi:hypothetical protein
LFENNELLKKEGNSLVYTADDGTIIKKFRKGWERNDDGCLNTVMAEFQNSNQKKISNVNSEEV